MPKPTLEHNQQIQEQALIEAMIKGLHEWRRDLDYPESRSDWQAVARGVMQHFLGVTLRYR